MNENLSLEFWLEEFGESYRPDACVLELLQLPGVADASWHNDVAPHFEWKLSETQSIDLWFYRADPNDRADESDSIPADQPRYVVNLSNQSPLGFESLDIIETENPLEAVNRFLMFAIAPEHMTRLALKEDK